MEGAEKYLRGSFERIGRKSDLIPTAEDVQVWVKSLPKMTDPEREKLVRDLVLRPLF